MLDHDADPLDAPILMKCPPAHRRTGLWAALILSLTLTVSSCVDAPVSDPPPRIQRLYEGDITHLRLMELLPQDAANYADRYQYCLHWSTEPTDNPERAAEVEEGIKVSCTGIEAQLDSIRNKYPPSSRVAVVLARVIADIDSGSYAFVLDDPGHRSLVLNRYYEAYAQEMPQRVDKLIAERHKHANTKDARLRDVQKYMAQVLTKQLAEVTANNDRLHPKTARDLRLAREKWERATKGK